MARVVLIESFVKQLRVPFFEGLIQYLQPRGVDLQVIFGQPDRFHAPDGDIVQELSFATKIHNTYINCGQTSLLWQPAMKYLKGADLVIVRQSNRNILNHLLVLTRELLGFKLAFFGHGKNFQSLDPDSLAEKFKRFYSRRADYWFAYNDRSKAVLRRMGFPDDRITSVQNAIDVTKLIDAYDNITPAQTQALRSQLGISTGDHAGVYCGRFYRDKDIDFTLYCAKRIHLRDGRFHFVLIGEGEEAQKVQAFCQSNSTWAHYVGPCYSQDRARFFRLARCQIMPGVVGLSIIDSFAMLTPLITRENPRHGPEIDYLRDGWNGLLTDESAQAYISEVVRYMNDPACQKKLVRGCLESRTQYTVENMVQRFGEGICKALAITGRNGQARQRCVGIHERGVRPILAVLSHPRTGFITYAEPRCDLFDKKRPDARKADDDIPCYGMSRRPDDADG